MEQKRPYLRRNRAAEEEEKVWMSFYRNATDPDVAAELIAHMDKDAASRAQYPGLYLRCRQSLRRAREREARARRYASGLQRLLRFVVLVPAKPLVWCLKLVRTMAQFASEVALSVCDGGAPSAAHRAPKATTTRRAAVTPTAAPAGGQTQAADCTPSAASGDSARTV